MHLSQSAILLSLAALGSALSKGIGNGPSNWPIDAVRKHNAALQKRDYPASELYPTHYLSGVPVDHFHNDSMYAPHSDDTFKLRYWFDASHYVKGGPVIVLQGGETSGAGRLPFLQKGVLAQIAQATGGVAVVLEHRYYGDSFPTPDLSTENLRFLTTQQSLADTAYFAQNIVFPGLEHLELTSKTTAYIGYGGSYAGAYNAILRVAYPEVFWGTISSSGVTEAIYDYWAYFEPIAHHGPPACIASLRTLTHIVDNIIIGKKEDANLTATLQAAFQLSGISHVQDFANTLATGIYYWQSLNWDPAVTDNTVFEFCDTISNTSVIYPDTESLRETSAYLINEGGYKANETLENQFLNYIGFVNTTLAQPCIQGGQTLDECYTTFNATFYQQDDLGQYDWRSWAYQYCTQWGFLQTGSGVPANELPLISRSIDLPYTSMVCRDAFGINSPSDVQKINQYGGYNISYSRLAIIDGIADPWRDATPHAFEFGAKNRPNTLDKPFILIGGNAVHHWDENGLFPNQTTAQLPPPPVAETQRQEVVFVKKWMADWKAYQAAMGNWNNGNWNGGQWGSGGWNNGHW